KDELYDMVIPVLRRETSAHWVALLKATGVPCAPVLSVEDAYNSALTAERGLVSMIPHPSLGSVANVASAIRMSGTPSADPTAAPRLGEHGPSILRDELGYDDARIAKLQEIGALGKRA